MIRRMDLPDEGDDALVEVWNYPNIPAAEVGKYKLELNGIEAEIFGNKVDSYYLTAIGGISLRVRKSDYPVAKAVLQAEGEVAETVVREADEISRTSDYCPHCHSLRVRRKRIRPIPGGLAWWKALKHALGFKYLWGCRDCGNSWRTY